MNLRFSNRWLIGANGALALALAASFFVDLYPALRPKQAEAGVEQYAWTAGSLGQETPFSEYRGIVRARTLFAPSQGAAEPAQQRTLIQDYELLGTFRRGSEFRAFLKSIGTKQSKTVAVGDWVGDYEIVEIGPEGVVFDKDGKKFTLKR